MVYQYVNLNQTNNTASSERIELNVVNDPYIIKNLNYDYRCAIDRIVIKRALTPLYLVSSRTLTVRVRNIVANTTFDADLNFNQQVDSDGFVNSYNNYATVLDKAIEDAYVGIGGLLADAPVVSYIPSENKIKITYNSTVRNSYEISFNNALYSDLPSFPYNVINISNTFFLLDFLQDTNEGGGSFSLKTTETIGQHLNPISMIEVLSIGLPIIGEISGNNVQVKILTDFSVVYDSISTQNDIVYNALDGQYRWHSLTQQDILREFTITLRYRTIDDRLFDFKINSGGSVNIKLIFEKSN